MCCYLWIDDVSFKEGGWTVGDDGFAAFWIGTVGLCGGADGGIPCRHLETSQSQAKADYCSGQTTKRAEGKNGGTGVLVPWTDFVACVQCYWTIAV